MTAISVEEAKQKRKQLPVDATEVETEEADAAVADSEINAPTEPTTAPTPETTPPPKPPRSKQ
ncbi:MAG: hypothetical protein ACYCY2_03085 [Acidithiobacillus ferriphilus]